MSYYKRFGIIIGTQFWRRYIREVYKRGVADLLRLKVIPDLSKPGFTSLLCGVGNEATADEFIKFVLGRNGESTIVIIDLGVEQVRAVKQLVSSKYKDRNISVKRMNALELGKVIKPGTIDWIETDAVFEFFNYEGLKQLLCVWHKLLKQDGFVTTSATSSNSSLGRWVDKFKIWISRMWLGVRVYGHERSRLHELINESGFIFYERWTVFPYFRRYTMIKRV